MSPPIAATVEPEPAAESSLADKVTADPEAIERAQAMYADLVEAVAAGFEIDEALGEMCLEANGKSIEEFQADDVAEWRWLTVQEQLALAP